MLLYEDDELYHWGIKEDHKYIAKIKMPNGKFRYFYDKEEYQRYLNKGKNTVDKLLGKAKSAVKDVSKNIKNVTKDGDSKAKSSIDKISDKSTKGIIFLIPRSTFKKAINWLSKKFGFGDDGSDNSAISDKELEGHKYIAKVKLPNGKYRYFYDQNEYDSYLKRLAYQKNEPDFMKNVKDIDSNEIYTSLEDMDKINERFNPYDDGSTTENCANCSAAYELRRRGYDVEAALKDEDYNGRGDRVYDYFEDAEKLYVFSDGSTSKANEKIERSIWDSGVVSWQDQKSDPKAAEYYCELRTYSSNAIEKAITDNNPPGSRGFIDVTWKDEPSGHSIVYEVDNSGKVTIRDSQTYDTYDINELAGKVGQVSITRTDNLQLKKDILGAVNTNSDAERKYYVDEDRLRLVD